MLKRLTFLSALGFAALTALPVTAEPTADTVVARVNGAEITLGHIILARYALPQQFQQYPNDVLYQLLVDQLVQQTALEQSREGDLPKFIELSLENERRSLLASDAIEDIVADAADDAAIQAAYDATYSEGFGGDEFNAQHILVETIEEAQAIKAELDGGADFGQMAKDKSTGPSGPNGGDLGWFGLGQMVPEFEGAVIELAPGAISEPVQTQFGWHLIQLNEKRKTAAPELAQVREEIAGDLRQKAIEARIDELLSASEVEKPEIEIDPSILENIDLVRN
ncbi:peptidylprolyl isomerase [Phaeobacter marinintestinus]|uniref:peptidylprolyl isomerase n=1 Tax=Falsiphaeobacter marinintestinus TaxID=1492905 RepID=UPI0011B822EC|nr:peptidylprolyl isomerase [Phaeobacter marinintestinus]